MTATLGDDGNARLPHGRRTVPKDDARLEALGALEELNATLGCALAARPNWSFGGPVARIQSELVDLGALLAAVPDSGPTHPFPASALEFLDRLQAQLEEQVDPLLSVLLPGGDPLAAWLHLARAQCRRVERRVVTLARRYRVAGVFLAYLNRLGAVLFLLARRANRDAATEEPRFLLREEREREA